MLYIFYCNGGCGLLVLCNKEYDDDDDDDDDDDNVRLGRCGSQYSFREIALDLSIR